MMKHYRCEYVFKNEVINESRTKLAEKTALTGSFGTNKLKIDKKEKIQRL